MFVCFFCTNKALAYSFIKLRLNDGVTWISLMMSLLTFWGLKVVVA